ncbi:HmuY family protein [Hoylesella oralis]|uniref:HmuY family protein n=1 Tax=Hoylesella oralis TaxID=28134 RepID=UPI00360DCA6A
MYFAFKSMKYLAGCAIMLMVMACNGIFEGIYDDVPTAPVVTQGQLLVDAMSWKNWYYIDFDSLHQYIERGDTAGLLKAQTEFTAYPIPTVLTSGTVDEKTGIYTYWFDVFGQGVSNNEKRSFTPTDVQPAPKSWSIAIHRDNVRTNNGAVLETNYTSMDELPKNSSSFTGATFLSDEWTENAVWADQSQMLLSLIGCQGIKINKLLSTWLTLDIPPMPPSFTLNNHVFIIRLQNGNYAAVQLQNYMNAAGAKCWLTINYKYPY